MHYSQMSIPSIHVFSTAARVQDSLEVRQQVDRVVAVRKGDNGGLEYLIKWFFQPYKESTWEPESLFTSAGDREAIDR